MKKLIFSLIVFSFLQADAQTSSKLPPLDKSPMDMLYYPVNYPVLKIQDKATEPLVARIIYSRPLRNNRKVFGELVEYNTVWRLGANEATEIEFFKDVTIGGKKVAKGKYTMYAITTPEQWTVILNKDTNTWGAFKYDSTKDALRVNVPVQTASDTLDAFTLSFEKTSTGTNLQMAWENVLVSLPIVIK